MSTGAASDPRLQNMEDEGQFDDEGPQPADRSLDRVFTVSLLVFSLLILTGCIIRYTSVGAVEEQSEKEMKQLQNTSSPNHTHIQDQIKDLEAKNRQLQEEVNKLNISTKDCGSGWTRFGCSCYFTSSERKTWTEGRLVCMNEKESDLVVINSREEQDFVSELMKRDEFWIGLRTTQNKTVYEWEWVKESLLTETFWTGLSVPPTGLYVAACCDRQGKLIQSDYKSTDVKRFVCEK